MVRLIRTSMEIPEELFRKVLVLLMMGDYSSLREVVIDGLRKVVKEYPEDELNKKLKKYKKEIDKIVNSRRVVERGIKVRGG